MPRVHINHAKYVRQDFIEWIVGRMHTLGLTQEDMGKEFGISQAGFGAKVRKCIFSYADLQKLFKKLQATDEEILRFMKL